MLLSLLICCCWVLSLTECTGSSAHKSTNVGLVWDVDSVTQMFEITGTTVDGYIMIISKNESLNTFVCTWLTLCWPIIVLRLNHLS